jgi:tRNA(fMet)-specific endonuclease VapC
MSLLLDTNILFHLSKDPKKRLLNTVINPDVQKLYLSVVTLGEIRSIALRNSWGKDKWNAIEVLLKTVFLIDINENLVETYAQIDTFSQRRNPSFNDYQFATPRNMGKNDLWIASTAALLNLTLVTTDKDFDHLHKVFLEVRLINPEKI